MSLKNFIKGFKKGFKNFGTSVTNVVNFIILLIVYILGIGLSAIVARVVGKKFLDLSHNKDSYWVTTPIGTEDKDEYYRMY